MDHGAIRPAPPGAVTFEANRVAGLGHLRFFNVRIPSCRAMEGSRDPNRAGTWSSSTAIPPLHDQPVVGQ